MAQSLRIEYFHNPPAYFSGKKVSGNVILYLSNELSIDSLRIICHGLAFTRKAESKCTGIKKQRLTYSVFTDNEEYFHLDQTLLQKNKNFTNVNSSFLDAGVHKFPFEFHLPADCPNSFESKYGSIRYYCKALLKKDDSVLLMDKQLFTLLNGIDLNISIEAESVNSTSYSTELVHSKGKHAVICRLQLSNTKFVPGEMVRCKFHIWHASKKDKPNVTCVQLMQNIVCRGKNPKSKEVKQWEERKLLLQNERTEKKDCKTGTFINCDWDALEIPATIPTVDRKMCNIVQIHYELLFQVSIDKIPYTTAVPITIGLVPVKSRFCFFKSSLNSQRNSCSNIECMKILEPLISHYNALRKKSKAPNSFTILKLVSLSAVPVVGHQLCCSKVDVRNDHELRHIQAPIYFSPTTLVYLWKLKAVPNLVESTKADSSAGKFLVPWHKVNSMPSMIAEYRLNKKRNQNEQQRPNLEKNVK
ncbi:Arrestin domain-containing protein 3 [Trichinella pseudospiralis]|uniref:Arrestin domain-containing protein 3 n=1 Tax=Trichinella pseudospiralis TaxID=6337 RepID=A0A0V1FDB8_TRIPS|nr:Arrestin domain-containing protein 3 [Trichinella pseudospiralis]